MKLPSMKYADGITKGKQIKFGGMNHSRGAGDGELWDMRNLTSDHYPLLASRAPRLKYRSFTEPGGLFSWDGLCWVDGTKFYFRGEEKGQVAAGEKTFASMGAYVLIFPDKSNPTTSGGYYSRPELGSYSERLYGNITALEPALTEKRAALDTAQTSLVQAETDLKTMKGYLQQTRAFYDADPTNENATSYNQIVGAYNLAYDAYASAFKTYSTAYDAYKPYEDQLIDALAVYQLYSNQQQAAFDDWRGTIRDADTIQTEISAIDQQMADLEAAEAAAAEAARQQQLAEYQARQDAKPWHEKLLGYLGGVQDTTLPLAGVTPGTVESAINQPGNTEKPTSRTEAAISMKLPSISQTAESVGSCMISTMYA